MPDDAVPKVSMPAPLSVHPYVCAVTGCSALAAEAQRAGQADCRLRADAAAPADTLGENTVQLAPMGGNCRIVEDVDQLAVAARARAAADGHVDIIVNADLVENGKPEFDGDIPWRDAVRTQGAIAADAAAAADALREDTVRHDAAGFYRVVVDDGDGPGRAGTAAVAADRCAQRNVVVGARRAVASG